MNAKYANILLHELCTLYKKESLQTLMKGENWLCIIFSGDDLIVIFTEEGNTAIFRRDCYRENDYKTGFLYKRNKYHNERFLL